MKKFWKKTEGFTLVELIVVIAILGILAGVGTVGYSGYIKKANMAADQQLASGIKNALVLASYQGDLKPGTAVKVTKDGVTLYDGATPISDVNSDTTGLNRALVAAFGANYEETMKLKYDGWTGTAASADIANVNSSSFSKENLNDLLGDVNVLTTVLADFFGSNGTYEGLNEYADEMGVDKNNMQAMANLAVFDTAKNINELNKTKNAEILETYASMAGMADMSSTLQTSGMDAFSALAMSYASVEGVMNYIAANGSDEAKAAIAPIKANWTDTTRNNVGSAGDVTDLMNDTFGALTSNSALMKYYLEYAGCNAAGERVVELTDTQAYKDGQAFLSYMQGVEESAGSLTADSAFGQQDYFRSDKVASTVTGYISAAEILNGTSESAIVVTYGSDVYCYPNFN